MRTFAIRVLAGIAIALAAMAVPVQAQTFTSFPKTATAFQSSVVSIKAARGVLQWVSCSNPNAAVEYIQFFDQVAAPTVGTTPPYSVLSVPASTTYNFAVPVQFLNAIKAIPTTTPTGSTAPGSALVCTFGFN